MDQLKTITKAMVMGCQAGQSATITNMHSACRVMYESAIGVWQKIKSHVYIIILQEPTTAIQIILPIQMGLSFYQPASILITLPAGIS